MLKKKGSSKWALLKHVTRTNSIGACSSELYIFSLLKLPPPPRAAILVKTSDDFLKRDFKSNDCDLFGKGTLKIRFLSAR